MKFRSIALIVFLSSSALVHTPSHAVTAPEKWFFGINNSNPKIIALNVIGAVAACYGISMLSKKETSDKDNLFTKFTKNVGRGISGLVLLGAGVGTVLLSDDIIISFEKFRFDHPDMFNWCIK